MVRQIVYQQAIDKAYAEFAGLHDDEKPTANLVTGSMFVEVDTGAVFLFDEEAAAGSEWVEQFSLQST